MGLLGQRPRNRYADEKRSNPCRNVEPLRYARYEEHSPECSQEDDLV